MSMNEMTLWVTLLNETVRFVMLLCVTLESDQLGMLMVVISLKVVELGKVLAALVEFGDHVVAERHQGWGCVFEFSAVCACRCVRFHIFIWCGCMLKGS